MKLGILVSDLGTESLKDNIKKAHEIGYDCVEISACKDDNRPNIVSCSKSEARGIVEFTKDLGLEISGFQCHFHQGYASLDEKLWRDSIEHTKRVIELADALNVPVVHTVSGILADLDSTQYAEYTGKIDYFSRKEWGRLLEAYNELLDFAAKTKVKIGIEPVFVYIIGNYRTTKKFFEDLGRNDLYINFDPGHFPYHRESPIPIIEKFGKRIIHSHVKDGQILRLNEEDIKNKEAWAMEGNQEEFKFAPPGKGVLNWKEIVTNLEEVGYKGVLSLEMGHGYIGTPENIATENLAFFKKILEEE
ncbi:sugar phosphate isomerase/epimerase [Candidatus Calescamantes bacterium]|nr:sugar phosphate isomerase/epimerase [Candidatus Calescamantes bacterium]